MWHRRVYGPGGQLISGPRSIPAAGNRRAYKVPQTSGKKLSSKTQIVFGYEIRPYYGSLVCVAKYFTSVYTLRKLANQ